LDIDELIKEFTEGELKTLVDMKRLWLECKFSYIFEAQPSTSLTIFMQFLYNHSISESCHITPTNPLSQRLGALYVLYCLYETQPFKPPFKIYISLGELRRLKALVVNAKEKGIKTVSVLVKRMLEKNAFLFGFVNINDYSENERIKELVDMQNACIKKMHEKLLVDTEIERYLHLDMGMELDLEVLMKMSKEYEGTKSLAIREASEIVDVQKIKNMADDRVTVGDEVQKINKEWGSQNDTHQEQPMMFLTAENQQSDDELLQNGFMALLMGNESPNANGEVQHAPAEQHSMPKEEQDYDLEYAKELEDQLFGDML
ncbi:snRNA-activating protein complex subunit 1, partial [Bienertia sinuspersici]